MALAFISLFAQFFGFRTAHGLTLLIGFLAIVSILVYHAWHDNTRISYDHLRLGGVLATTLLVWIPFVIVLVPGVAITLWIDDNIDASLRTAERHAAGSIETIEEEVEETIQELESVPWSWWWPPDWFKEGTRVVERKVLRTVQRDILQPAPTWIRACFALLYAILRVSQLLLYSTITFISIRSFVFLFARSALYKGVEIRFNIP